MLQGDKLSWGWFWGLNLEVDWELRLTDIPWGVGIHGISARQKYPCVVRFSTISWLLTEGKAVCVSFLFMKRSSLGKNASFYAPFHSGNVHANSGTDRMSAGVLAWGSHCTVWKVSLPSFCKGAWVQNAQLCLPLELYWASQHSSVVRYRIQKWLVKIWNH